MPPLAAAAERMEQMTMTMKRQVIVIDPDAGAGLINCDPETRTLTLGELQKLVGGPIETVPTMLSNGRTHEDGARIVMIVNEEGRLLGLPHNGIASLIAAFGVGPIVGPAVIMAGLGDELIGLLPGAAKRIKAEWLTGDVDVEWESTAPKMPPLWGAIHRR